MAQIGQFNSLPISKFVDFGAYLDGGELGTILLPKKYLPKDPELGQFIDVFLYFDSESRLIATTLRPRASVGQCASMKVEDVNRIGAFVDWGLPKQLLVPFGQQRRKMEVGEYHVVFVYQDEYSELITGSSKLSNFLNEFNTDFVPDQCVDLLISNRTDLGYKAVINNSHLGMIFETEILQPLKIGQKLKGYIKTIREDGKLDLSLQLQGQPARDNIAEKILAYMDRNQGHCSITDKSTPEDIYQQFQTSKSNFKKAVGGLLKRKEAQYNDGFLVRIKN